MPYWNPAKQRSHRERIRQWIHTPIPEMCSQVGWREVPIRLPAIEEPLVPVGFLSQYPIASSSAYWNEDGYSPYADPMSHSRLTIFLRQSTALRATQISQVAPFDYHLLALDGFRDPRLQQGLYDMFVDIGGPQYAENYVVRPSGDPKDPSQHETGGSLDYMWVKTPRRISLLLRKLDDELLDTDPSAARAYELHVKRRILMRRHGRIIDSGLPFDHAGERAHPRHFEDRLEAGEKLDVLDNFAMMLYRLQFHAAWNAGFATEACEIWHLNAIETRKGALMFNRPYAVFGTATLSQANLSHDQRHRDYLAQEDSEAYFDVPMVSMIPAADDDVGAGFTSKSNVRSLTVGLRLGL